MLSVPAECMINWGALAVSQNEVCQRHGSILTETWVLYVEMTIEGSRLDLGVRQRRKAVVSRAMALAA